MWRVWCLRCYDPVACDCGGAAACAGCWIMPCSDWVIISRCMYLRLVWLQHYMLAFYRKCS